MVHAELSFTGDGISASLYDESGNVVDEAWFTYSEIEERKNGGNIVLEE